MGPFGSGTKPPNGLRCKSTSPLVEAAQLPRPCRMAQLAQCLRLDLPDALPGDREPRADLLEGEVAALADAEAQAQDLLLARRQRAEDPARLAAEIRREHGVGWRHGGFVLDEVTEVAVLLLADRRLERDRFPRDPEHAPD